MDATPSINLSASLVGTTFPGPWGPILMAATEAGLVAVDLMAVEDDFRAAVERRVRRPMVWVPAAELGMQGPDARRHLHLAFRALLIALPGAGPSPADRATSSDDASADLALLELDLQGRPEWDRAVLSAVRAIPRGETRSYGDIARAIGRAGAARAVGGAVGRNPIGFIIPCHRVIAADGTLGGYGGGWWGDRERLLDLKSDLLAREGRMVRRGGSGTTIGR